MNKSEKEFNELHGFLYQQIIRWKIFKDMYERILDAKNDAEPAFNFADGFFEWTKVSLWNTTGIWAEKLMCDRRDKPVNIWRYLEFVENNKRDFINGDVEEGIIDQKLKDHRTELKEKERILHSIKGRRDKSWAHFDKNYISKPKELEKDFPLQKDEMDQVWGLAAEILDEYAKRYKGARIGQVSNFNINYADLFMNRLNILLRNRLSA